MVTGDNSVSLSRPEKDSRWIAASRRIGTISQDEVAGDGRAQRTPSQRGKLMEKVWGFTNGNGVGSLICFQVGDQEFEIS